MNDPIFPTLFVIVVNNIVTKLKKIKLEYTERMSKEN